MHGLVKESLNEEIHMSVIAATESRSIGCSVVVELMVRAVTDYQLHDNSVGCARHSAGCHVA